MKPPEDNTIDFLVRIQQEDGKDKIGYKNVNGVIKNTRLCYYMLEITLIIKILTPMT